MPAAPGATPRKMLPPPMTAPISTPRRDTCATSSTMASIVARLMPYGSSPIRASPDSLSRIRLYFGVNQFSPSASRACLGHHLGREIAAFLLDAFSDHEEGIGVHLGLLCGEVFLHGLLVVLHEGLAEKRQLAQELVERPLHHLGRDFGRLAGLFGARKLDFALALHDVRGDFRLGH